MQHTAKWFGVLGLAIIVAIGGTSAAETTPEAKNDPGRALESTKKRSLLAGPRAKADDVRRSGRDLTGKRHRRGPTGVQAALEKLDLTGIQKSRVRALFARHHEAQAEFRRKAGPQIKQLRSEWEAARKAGDRGPIERLRQRRQQLMKDAPSRDAIKIELAKILTSKQLEQFETAVKAQRDKGKARASKHDQRRRRRKNADKHRNRKAPDAVETPNDQNPPDKGAEDGKLHI